MEDVPEDTSEWNPEIAPHATVTKSVGNIYVFAPAPTNWRSVFGGSVREKVENEDTYYFHAFAKKQPDLNWENPEMRKDIYKMINWWLDKGISGFRVDAINFIKKDQRWC